MPTGPQLEAFALVLHAYESAKDAGADPWQFAISLRELEAAGLTATDVRWLLLKSYALLAKEVTAPGDDNRQFRTLPFTALCRSACLTLTEVGAAEIARRLSRQQPPPAERPAETSDEGFVEPKVRPSWDSGRRELRIGHTIVKRFRVPAANQELVLQAFEEEGWPPCIDDPLPPAAGIDCQYRLRATIKSLNRSQQNPLVRFHGNGGGQVIYWDLTADRAGSPSHARRQKV